MTRILLFFSLQIQSAVHGKFRSRRGGKQIIICWEPTRLIHHAPDVQWASCLTCPDCKSTTTSLFVISTLDFWKSHFRLIFFLFVPPLVFKVFFETKYIWPLSLLQNPPLMDKRPSTPSRRRCEQLFQQTKIHEKKKSRRRRAHVEKIPHLDCLSSFWWMVTINTAAFHLAETFQSSNPSHRNVLLFFFCRSHWLPGPPVDKLIVYSLPIVGDIFLLFQGGKSLLLSRKLFAASRSIGSHRVQKVAIVWSPSIVRNISTCPRPIIRLEPIHQLQSAAEGSEKHGPWHHVWLPPLCGAAEAEYAGGRRTADPASPLASVPAYTTLPYIDMSRSFQWLFDLIKFSLGEVALYGIRRLNFPPPASSEQRVPKVLAV